ncbi:spasmodic peptide gm9a [Trichuris suis]|nr:spasmodic peptide gm9a [Trichuris suis]
MVYSCKTQDDCIGLSICYKGNCVPAVPTPDYRMCNNDTDCQVARSEICRYGVCMIPFGSNACQSHTDCSSTQVCENKVCVDAEPTEKACSASQPCDPTQVCRNGLCWKKYEPPVEGQCETHANCPGNELCVEKRCKMSVPAHDCNEDRDCQQGAFCKNAKCWKVGCMKHDECEGAKLCNAKQSCQQAKRFGGRCLTDANCGSNSACKMGFCWTFV